MMKRHFCSFMFFVIAGIIYLPMSEAKEIRLKYGTTSVRAVAYGYGVMFAKAVHKAYPGEINVTVVETGGWVENLSRMRLGLLDIAQVNPVAAYTAYHGLLDFKDQKNPNIRFLFVQCIGPVHFIVSKASGVTTIEGLTGKKMASNPLSTSERLGRMFLEANGIKPDYKWGGTSSNLEAMKAGTVDAWQRSDYRDAAVVELALSRPITILSVTEEHIKKYNEKYPAHGKGMLAPAGQFSGQDKPYYTLAFVGGTMVKKDFPADLVYKITKAIWDGRMEMVKVDSALRDGGFADFPKLTLENNDVPLHPGVVKFYRDLGYKIPDKLLPPEMK